MDIVSNVEKAPATQPTGETNRTPDNIAMPSSSSPITPPQKGVRQSGASSNNALIESVVSAHQDAAMATPPKTPMAKQHQPTPLLTRMQLSRSTGPQKSSAPAQAGASTSQHIRNTKRHPAPGPAAPKEASSYAHTITSLDGKAAPIQSSQDWFTRAGLDLDQQTGNPADWQRYVNALGLRQGEFPKIQVEGKMKQSGKVNKDGKPDWNFAIYTVLAVSPNGRLKLKQIFNICMAWSHKLGANNASCRHNLCIKPEFVNFKDDDAKDKNDGGYWRLATVDEGAKIIAAKEKSDAAQEKTEDQTEPQSKKRKAKTSTSPELPSQSTTVQNAPATPRRRSFGFSPVNIDSAYQSGTSTPAPEVTQAPQVSQRPVRIRKPTLKRRGCEQERAWEQNEYLQVVSDDPREEESPRGNGGSGPRTQASRKRQKTAKSSTKASLDQSSTQTQCNSRQTQSTRQTQDSNEIEINRYTRYKTASGPSYHIHLGGRPDRCHCIPVMPPKPKLPPPRLNPFAATGPAFPNGWIAPPVSIKDDLLKPPRKHIKKNDDNDDLMEKRMEMLRFYIPSQLDFEMPYSTVGRYCDSLDTGAGVVEPCMPERRTPFGMA